MFALDLWMLGYFLGLQDACLILKGRTSPWQQKKFSKDLKGRKGWVVYAYANGMEGDLAIEIRIVFRKKEGDFVI